MALRFLASGAHGRSKPYCCPISGLGRAGGHPLTASLGHGLLLPPDRSSMVIVRSGWEPMLAAWQALCWEKLHTGNWKEVRALCPHAYNSSSLTFCSLSSKSVTPSGGR